ncbi:MAG: DNA translocase FtsK, partial [Anaerolineae bacterium]|nr:DNA translocase FtsK [Anaerolineae bacterium]
FPARVSFAVSTQVDSRVILDAPGAEQLLGRGDMLFMPPDAAKLIRIQGSYVTEGELARLVNYWKGLNGSLATGDLRAAPDASLVQKPLWQEVADEEEGEGDPLLDDAIALVRAQNRASVSLLQRKLRVGYARAARIMDLLEEQGIVGPPEGPTHSRQVLVGEEEEEEEGAEHEYDYEENGE